jgi:ribonuclease PH
MSDDNKIIEIQSSSEKGLHNIHQLNLMYENGLKAINQLFMMQKKIIEKEFE